MTNLDVLQPRIMGTELEYGASLINDQGQVVDLKNFTNTLLSGLPDDVPYRLLDPFSAEDPKLSQSIEADLRRMYG